MCCTLTRLDWLLKLNSTIIHPHLSFTSCIASTGCLMVQMDLTMLSCSIKGWHFESEFCLSPSPSLPLSFSCYLDGNCMPNYHEPSGGKLSSTAANRFTNDDDDEEQQNKNGVRPNFRTRVQHGDPGNAVAASELLARRARNLTESSPRHRLFSSVWIVQWKLWKAEEALSVWQLSTHIQTLHLPLWCTHLSFCCCFCLNKNKNKSISDIFYKTL